MKLMGWRKMKITNRQGLKLAVLVRRAKVAPSSCGDGAQVGLFSSAPEPSPPLVIVCHGFTGSKEGGGGAVAMADALAGRGFATLLFDFTGCGESEGLWEEITLSRQVEDLGAIVEWARQRGYRRIILNGRSFGGATALAYAAADRQLDAVCTWAATARPLQFFSGFAGQKINPAGSAGERIALDGGSERIYLQRRFFQDLQSHDLLRCAAGISPHPLLLIHGTADEVVPPADARLLFEAAGEPKELALIKGADHRFSDHRRQIWDLFFRWLSKIQERQK